MTIATANALDTSFHQFLMNTRRLPSLLADNTREQKEPPSRSVAVTLPDHFVGFAQGIDALIVNSRQPSSLGISMAEKINQRGKTLLTLIASTAETVGDALSVLSRYHVLSQGLLPEPPQRIWESGQMVLRFADMPVQGTADHLVIDAMLSLWAAMIRQVMPRQFMFESVQVQYSRHSVDHERVLMGAFKAPVKYRSPSNGLTFDKRLLVIAMPDANPSLHQQLVLLGDFLIMQLKQEKTLAVQVHDWLLQHLRGQVPSLERCAEALGMTSWTLRRRLTDEGSSFNRILENLRKSLAISYIAEGRLSNGEIGYVLGFSNSGAFQRAFKRWTGDTPGNSRRAQHGSVRGRMTA